MATKEKKKKVKSETISAYKKWNAARIGLYTGMYVMPLMPATIMTCVNWNEWFNASGVSLPMGLITLLIGVLMAIMGITKRDELFKKNVSGLFYFVLVFAIIGISFKFLANICNQMGDMFLFTACGVLGSGGCDQLNKSLVKPRVEEYKELIESNFLNAKAKAKQERKLRAEQEAREQRKQDRLPTE